MPPLRRYATGFTILELMISVSVLSILLAIGVPGFTNVIRTNRIATQTNNLIGALNYARGETAVRGQPISMCAANADRSACSNNNDWSNGWIIFTDRTGVVGEFDPLTDTMLQVSDQPVMGFAVAATGRFVRFGGTFAPTTAETFTVTPTVSAYCVTTRARRIQMGATGRISTSKVDCS
jgi:type IV fimbrial biogenesis protein FimT